MLQGNVISCFKILVLSVVCVTTATANTNIPETRRLSNEPVRMGNYEVHYSAFNSTFLSPHIAAAYQLERGSRSGIVNIAIRNVKNSAVGRAVAGRIDGHAMNLLSQKSELKFNEVREGDAIYYLASFRFSNEELLAFKINIQPESQASSKQIEFRQTFFEGQ